MLTWNEVRQIWLLPILMFIFTIWLIGTGHENFLVLENSTLLAKPNGEVVKTVEEGEILRGKFADNKGWKRIRNPEGWIQAEKVEKIFHNTQWGTGLGLILLPLIELYIGICALYRITRGENH